MATSDQTMTCNFANGMTYEKNGEAITLTLDKEDAVLMKDAIISSCLPTKRQLFGLKKFIEDSYPDLK